MHVEPSPSHTPHSSKLAEPPQLPEQSFTFPSQSHAPGAISAQPHSYTSPGPSHIPQTSSTATPPHSPEQSCVHGSTPESPPEHTPH